ncbi:MAG: hypothetical protein HKP30_17580 [Myxococcales bacterium]|nr:hypothetical protein [Myxococcales bacterium]
MRFTTLCLALSAFVLLACGPPSKHDILSKAETITTKSELEAELGSPSERSKLGPIETWTYQAKDGEVTFLITGDVVRLQATD